MIDERLIDDCDREIGFEVLALRLVLRPVELVVEPDSIDGVEMDVEDEDADSWGPSAADSGI